MLLMLASDWSMFLMLASDWLMFLMLASDWPPTQKLASDWSMLLMLASDWSMLLILVYDWQMLFILSSDWSPGVSGCSPLSGCGVHRGPGSLRPPDHPGLHPPDRGLATPLPRVRGQGEVMSTYVASEHKQ